MLVIKYALKCRLMGNFVNGTTINVRIMSYLRMTHVLGFLEKIIIVMSVRVLKEMSRELFQTQNIANMIYQQESAIIIMIYWLIVGRITISTFTLV